MKTITEPTPVVYAGLDIAKASLQLDLPGRACPLPHTPAGHRHLVRRRRRLPAVHVVCEATGGQERAVVAALQAAGLPVRVVNPAKVRHFALAQGQRAKTDPLDAAVLRAFGEALRPAPTPVPEAALAELRALVQWRQHLLAQKQAASQQAEHDPGPFVRRQLARLQAHWERPLAAVEAELAAALAGLAPWTRQSGPWQGQRHIGGGRRGVRRTLSMPAVALARMPHTKLGRVQARLRAAGKPAKVALTAVMRHLLVQMNHVLKSP